MEPTISPTPTQTSRHGVDGRRRSVRSVELALTDAEHRCRALWAAEPPVEVERRHRLLGELTEVETALSALSLQLVHADGDPGAAIHIDPRLRDLESRLDRLEARWASSAAA